MLFPYDKTRLPVAVFNRSVFEMAVGCLWVMLQLWWLHRFIWQHRRTKNTSPGSMPHVSLKVNSYNLGFSLHFIFVSWEPSRLLANHYMQPYFMLPTPLQERKIKVLYVGVSSSLQRFLTLLFVKGMRVSAPVKLTPSSSVSWMAHHPNADRPGRPESKPNSY